MTAFYLLQGYCHSEKERISTEELLNIANGISLESLREKAIEYGVPAGVLGEYVEKYRAIPSKDLTVTISDRTGLCQMASGGDPCRTIKEKMRKAFGILVLDECYKRGKSVNFEIA